MADLQKQVQKLHTLTTQLNENELVLKEIDNLPQDCEIFKSRGIGLTKMDPTEAVQNVQKRLDFIKAEKERVEKAIEEAKNAQVNESWTKFVCSEWAPWYNITQYCIFISWRASSKNTDGLQIHKEFKLCMIKVTWEIKPIPI